MRGYTKKTCPGCNKEPERVRPTTGVCDDCRHKLERYPALVEIAEKIDAETPMLILDLERFGLRFFGPSHHHRSYGDDEEKTVSDAVKAVIAAFAMEYKGVENLWGYRPWAPLDNYHLEVTSKNRSGRGDVGNEFFLIPAKAADALQTLVDAIDDFAAVSARLGVEYGKSMVKQLVDGKMTSDDFTPEKKERN